MFVCCSGAVLLAAECLESIKRNLAAPLKMVWCSGSQGTATANSLCVTVPKEQREESQTSLLGGPAWSLHSLHLVGMS